MKKLIGLVAIALISAGSLFAQTATTTQTKKGVKKVEAKTTATSKTQLKKDGTPDMRFKDNKNKAIVVAGPKKKDGTADMRYKANKATVKK